ncbi:hypothetical protein LUX29_10770 [Aureimonas altamirensis]|uniref:hypothetical protein n=1 Tax=Aureimonas altamirensis TaxID=370622 RepID=UPI001E2903B5|nr:hypothetical protein [Aureimonas altamirensis]UHD47606.1 hypothetical protein LUX29_10770 [Aureimonas altamirensis]
MLETTRGDNSSGFTFGVVQLDIGSNSFAMEAYDKILLHAYLIEGDISSVQFENLMKYRGSKRPDLDKDLALTYKNDRAFLNTTVFSKQYAQDYIDLYTNKYLDSSLVKKVNAAIDKIVGIWGDDTVFNPSHKDYNIAVAALTSVLNKTGSGGEALPYLHSTRPDSISVVHTAFDKVAEPRWDLVEIGAAMLDVHCFIAGTKIAMWDGSDKPIEKIVPEDVVVSYDKDGTLKPGRVTRTFQNHAKVVLDFHGIGMTPGHLTLCGDGPLKGKHVPIIDILRTDGAVVGKDGSLRRASTNCPVGSIGDLMVQVITGQREPGGMTRVRESGYLRAGTRIILPDGTDIAILQIIAASGGILCGNGMITETLGGPEMPFFWRFTESLPKPEDYVLQRSDVTLDDIYAANEWEDSGPRLPFAMAAPSNQDSVGSTILRAQGVQDAQSNARAPTPAAIGNRRQRRANASAARKSPVLH